MKRFGCPLVRLFAAPLARLTTLLSAPLAALPCALSVALSVATPLALLAAPAARAEYQPPYVPPFSACAPPEDRVGKLSVPRDAPFVFTLGRGPEGVDRWALLQELQSWTEMVCAQAGVPGAVVIEMGPEGGGSWNAYDDTNWIWWDDVIGGAGAVITDHGGHPDAWWRTEVADCVFNTSPSLGIQWHICAAPTDDPDDIDIGTVWGHELMHVLGADHSDPCDAANSIMAAYSRVCCEDAHGPLAWDQIYLDLLHLRLDLDLGEDTNSYPNTPTYLGPLMCLETGAYDGFGLHDVYLYVMDHDHYSLQLNYDPTGAWLFHVFVDVGENVHSTIKFTVDAESGPEPAQTEYAIYNHPGEVFVDLTGDSGRFFEVRLHELGHWGTEHGVYLVYFELYGAVQGIDGPGGMYGPGSGPGGGNGPATGSGGWAASDPAATQSGPRIYQVFDIEGRLLYQEIAPNLAALRTSRHMRQALGGHAQGTLLWRAVSPSDGRPLARGKLLHLKGAYE